MPAYVLYFGKAGWCWNPEHGGSKQLNYTMVVWNNCVILLIIHLGWYLYAIWFWTTNYIHSDKTRCGHYKRATHTPVKLITFSMADMAVSPFSHHKALSPLPKATTARTTGTGQCSTLYSILKSEIKWRAQMTNTLWPSKQQDKHWFSKSIINCLLLNKSKDCWGRELKISDSSYVNVAPWECSVCTDWLFR